MEGPSRAKKRRLNDAQGSTWETQNEVQANDTLAGIHLSTDSFMAQDPDSFMHTWYQTDHSDNCDDRAPAALRSNFVEQVPSLPGPSSILHGTLAEAANTELHSTTGWEADVSSDPRRAHYPGVISPIGQKSDQAASSLFHQVSLQSDVMSTAPKESMVAYHSSAVGFCALDASQHTSSSTASALAAAFASELRPNEMAGYEPHGIICFGMVRDDF